ncbi:MAG: 50S ribosomal protein L17 [bacterium]|nr:50S ribosomal protein L17 [bacterium]
MRHRVAGRKLGRPTDERIALFRSLITSLFRYGKISTTEMKAKEIRPIAEKLITLAGTDDLHARRQVIAYLYDKEVASKLFSEIGPRYKERPGGYTRILKVGFRRGDAAPMAIIELV